MVDRTNVVKITFLWASRRCHTLSRQEKAVQKSEAESQSVPSVWDIAAPLHTWIFSGYSGFFPHVNTSFGQ